MTLNKFWRTFKIQWSELADFLWSADPVDQMQSQYDRAVDQFKEGRQALEQYRALVERVMLRIADQKGRVANLEARVRDNFLSGNRPAAAAFALQLQQACQDLADNEDQLKRHEEAYRANVASIKQVGAWLAQMREKIVRYDAERRLSQVEAAMARRVQEFQIELAADFGQVEQVVQNQINHNWAEAGSAAESARISAETPEEEAQERVRAERALRQFVVQMGLLTAEAAPVKEVPKPLGSATMARKNSAAAEDNPGFSRSGSLAQAARLTEDTD